MDRFPRFRSWKRWLAVILVTAVLGSLGFYLSRRHREIAPRGMAHYLPSLDLVAPADLARLPLADRFDFPIGSPSGAMAYNAQHFQEWNEQFQSRHLGDDLNGIGGYNTDLGDPVFAIANGQVIYSALGEPGWGNIIIVMHALEEDGRRRYVQSYYAHLLERMVQPGETVARGQQIATIGNAGGRYFAHLHFEMREFLTRHVGAGYREDPAGWLDPSAFVLSHRGGSPDDLR